MPTAKRQKPAEQYVGTGTDPVGRYKRGEHSPITDEDEAARLIASGHLQDPDQDRSDA